MLPQNMGSSSMHQAAPKLKGKVSRSLAAKTALAIRYDALGDGQDNPMGLENRAKLEAHLRVLEGRELGSSAGSTKGKPKIKFYNKDQNKGAGALITPAKTYNPSSDLVLSQSTEPAAKSADEQVAAQPGERKHEEAEAAEKATLKEGGVDDGEKRRKKKRKADIDSTQLQRDRQSDAAEADEEQENEKKKKKAEVHGAARLEDEDLAVVPEAEEEPSRKEKKKKRKQTGAEEPSNQIKEQAAAETGKKEKKKKDKKDG